MKIKVLSRVVWLMLALALLLAACGGGTPQPPSTPTATPQAEETPEVEATGPPEGEELAQGEDLLAEIVVTRTPQPTATPDRAAQTVSKLTRAIGLARWSFLGLGVEDWINLGISLVIVLIGFGIGTLLTRVFLRWIARRTSPGIGEAIRKTIGPRLRWLVIILVLSFAANRLALLSAEIKTILGDVFFALGMILGALILWSLIDLAYEWQHAALRRAGRAEELDPALILVTRVGRIVLVVCALSILLAYFGINVTALAAALGIGGLAFSLAAQDTLSDAIAGFIILADRPYRVGDRIEIQGAGTWGDVVDIGLRTTRIRTRDNRMIIVPNSMIGKNQIINYTYPDPRYRIETQVGIAYGTDIETARQVIAEAVRGVQGVLPDKPVDALYIDMGDSAMLFRVRWWIESYVDTRRVVDRVYTAMQKALDAASIECPYPIRTVNLQVKPEAVDGVSPALPPIAPNS